MAVDPQSQLQLPMGVVTHADVGRLMQEIEAVDGFVRQAGMQQQSSPLQLPKSSRMFDELVAINKLDMLKEEDRRQITQLLQVVRTKAPVLHMSFSTDPSPLFTERLMTWLRQQIHPFVLLQVGLLPNIGAGCVLRTTNKYYDFSLKQRFSDTRPMLISKLRGADAAPPSAEPATVTPESA